jgi:hypothetical protein
MVLEKHCDAGASNEQNEGLFETTWERPPYRRVAARLKFGKVKKSGAVAKSQDFIMACATQP